jgi:diguanylate cyclase (GGDEF)-like protein
MSPDARRRESRGHLRNRATALSFGARLALAVVTTFAAVGVVAYFVVIDRMRERHVARYVVIERAQVRDLEALGRIQGDPARAVREVDRVLHTLGGRPGTVELALIDSRHVVRASGVADDVVGHHDSDTRIDAALTHGTSYAGQETGQGDRANFEFVSPVNLPGGRYALVVTYDHHFLDATATVVRDTMQWFGLLALIGGGAVFYLVGGRSLMRSQRIALERATRDGLTGLPNQRAFQEDVERAVALAARREESLTLAVLDVDDFKFLNHREGHPRGDAVLRRVADVISEGRVEDRAYRIGGDEFALLLPRVDEHGARTLGRRIMRALSTSDAPVSLGLTDLRSGESAADLRTEADAALAEARHRGGNGMVHFDEIRDQVLLTSSDNNDAVRRLIDEGAVSTVFQPIWDIHGGILLGVEALTRPDAGYGVSGPAEVFDVAEQIGRVHELDELCVRSALRIAPQLPDRALLFVNLSPHTLDVDACGNDWLSEAVDGAEVERGRVVVEVTERFGGRVDSVVTCLQRLRDQGFKLALDDVGTGNSGLEMLHRVRAEFVKIDRSIVLAAPVEPTARAVLMAIATYAAQTGSFVIAEGIEDEETLDFLASIDMRDVQPQRIIMGGQGYGLGRPAQHVASEPPVLLARPRPFVEA